MRKNNTTTNTMGSAVATYKLTAEQLAKYNTPSITSHETPTDYEGKPITNRQKALPRVPKKEYTPKAYTTNDNDLFELGVRTGYNAMKSKYHKSASEDLNPNKNHAELEDFEGISLLAICEYMASADIDNDTISDEELHTIRRCCYDAVNHEAYRIKRDAKKHLYIENLIPDEDGETIITQIEDVTARIEHEEDFELWELLKPYTTIQDRKILKWYAKGYTTETCCKRLKCTERTYFRKLKKARTHAQKALQGTDFER